VGFKGLYFIVGCLVKNKLLLHPNNLFLCKIVLFKMISTIKTSKPIKFVSFARNFTIYQITNHFFFINNQNMTMSTGVRILNFEILQLTTLDKPLTNTTLGSYLSISLSLITRPLNRTTKRADLTHSTNPTQILAHTSLSPHLL
jgi:hypothetical protein